MKAIIIGSGVGGLATAIRLAKLGLKVDVFESNPFPGGKVNSILVGDFRYDMGPSVCTEPHLVDELVALCGKEKSFFQYKYLKESFRYFFQDGQKLSLHPGGENAASLFEKELGENKETVEKYLANQEKNYKAVYPVFIEVSLHRIKHWLNESFWKAISRLFKYGIAKSMHKVNVKIFKNPKTVKIFDRFATYNGSSPYKTPGMLNIISHLELNVGPVMPKGGMVAISNTLYNLSLELGVKYHFNEKVEQILHEKDEIKGIKTVSGNYSAEIVVSNADVHFTYEKLLNNYKAPKLNLKQEKSSSAIVFYWGINAEFEDLGVHNIFFSDTYKNEFESIFDSKTMTDDPTIYVHISSKVEQNDAPKGKENWFVMVNAPINTGQDWNEIVERTRKNCLERLSKALGRNVETLIEAEQVNDPIKIEAVFSGKQGSIYGNSSNSSLAAFLRHPNFSKQIKGLYFTGVTVHPGGGIPLALNSAKIVEKCLREDYNIK